MSDKLHWLIVVSGYRVPKTVRMMFDQTIVLPANHRHYEMVSNDGSVIVAFANKINEDADSLFIEYLEKKCPITMAMKLRSAKKVKP